jgi:hypothetical protein
MALTEEVAMATTMARIPAALSVLRGRPWTKGRVKIRWCSHDGEEENGGQKKGARDVVASHFKRGWGRQHGAEEGRYGGGHAAERDMGPSAVLGRQRPKDGRCERH